MPLAGAILAGGQAARLGGRPKGLLPFGSGRILDYQIRALREAVGDGDIVIIANDPRVYEPLGVRVVADRMPGTGALGGLFTALAECDAPLTIVLACDLPFVTGAFAAFLAAECHGRDVALPKTLDGFHPLCACWSRDATPELERRLAAGERRIIDALSALRVREIGPAEVARFEHVAGTLLFNVNTPHEYERALQLEQIVSRPLNPS
jgi:molybdopterin-guanine dinucleotide biosynthesis protein A